MAISLLSMLPSSAIAEPESGPATAMSEWAASCDDWDEWDKAGPPFKVYGNTYYVGTCGISAILITAGPGHILIDGGTEAGAQSIAANIETLGLTLTDVKMLLMSHEHHDHVGGLARLQQLTGAALLASAKAAPIIAGETPSKDDPQAGLHDPLPAARVLGVVSDGEQVKIGRARPMAIYTPGHTPGALSWQWESCEGDDCKTIVYADSLTPVSNDDYRFSDHPDYVAAFRESLDKLARLDCDILLSPHPSASGMRDKLIAGDLTSGMNCRDYATGLRERLDARLAQEAEAAN